MEQYVMTTGTIRMPLLSVHNLDSLPMVYKEYFTNNLIVILMEDVLSICTIGAVSVSAPDYFSEGQSPGRMTSVNCSGTESTILECDHVTSIIGLSCNTAGVICQGIKIIRVLFIQAFLKIQFTGIEKNN